MVQALSSSSDNYLYVVAIFKIYAQRLSLQQVYLIVFSVTYILYFFNKTQFAYAFISSHSPHRTYIV